MVPISRADRPHNGQIHSGCFGSSLPDMIEFSLRSSSSRRAVRCHLGSAAELQECIIVVTGFKQHIRQEFYQLIDQNGISDDIHLFNEEVREWEHDYNYHRPRRTLQGQTPFERLIEKSRADVSPGSRDPTANHVTGIYQGFGWSPKATMGTARKRKTGWYKSHLLLDYQGPPDIVPDGVRQERSE